MVSRSANGCILLERILSFQHELLFLTWLYRMLYSTFKVEGVEFSWMWDKTFRQTWLELFSVLTRILTIRAKQLVILIINLYSNCHLKFTTTLGCQRHLSPESTSEHFFIGQLPFLHNVLLIITCLKHYKKKSRWHIWTCNPT